MFNRQVEHYKKKFIENRHKLNDSIVLGYLMSEGMDLVALKAEFEMDSVKFRTVVSKLATFIQPGRISCVSYANALSKICEMLNIHHTINAGFCLPRNYPNFSKEMEMYNSKKSQGVLHPTMATHVYVTVNDKIYEFYNGEFSNIEHIDCVVILEVL